MAATDELHVRVVEVVRETGDAHSLVLQPVDDTPLDYHTGQFLTVDIPSDREGGAARCYSLCSSPHAGERPTVTVKRTVAGYGSNWLCDHAVAGSTLRVLRPSGTFTPRSLDDDLVLLAAGSGITPVMSILKSCLHAGTGSVTLVYANRDERSVIFRDELLRLGVEFPDRLTVVHWLESVQGLPTEPGLRALVAPYAAREAFLCGPGAFMDLAQSVLATLGAGRDRVHVERFSSLQEDPFAAREIEIDGSDAACAVDVELDGETTTVAWPEQHTLLDVLLDAGLDAPYSCREGRCSACACLLLDGEVTLDRNEILDEGDLADGLILACQARPVTERLTITYEG